MGEKILKLIILISLANACFINCDKHEQLVINQKQAIPDTPAGKQLSLVLQIFNTGDRKLIREFIENSMSDSFRTSAPIEAHLNYFCDTYDFTREFDVLEIPECNEYAATAKVKYHLLEEVWNIRVELDSKPPHKVDGIALWPADSLSQPAITEKLSPKQVANHLKKFTGKLSKLDIFSGVVMLAKGTKVLLLKPYCQANKEYSARNRADTRFNLGSMNKMFTAVAIAQLAEKGKISYDDYVNKYLDSTWLNPNISSKIKISNLLSHTSGLGNIFIERFEKSSRTLFRTVQDYKQLFSDQKLAFEPGTRWQYSNAGFVLLGAIIEKVTEQTYFDYVRKNIFIPSSMFDTDSYELDRSVPNLASGYQKDFNDTGYTFKNNLFDHLIKGCPAGGGFSTAVDLLKFVDALQSGRLLNNASKELLLSAKPEMNSPHYGYGFGVEQNSKLGRITGHTGGFIGISCCLNVYLDAGYTLIVLSNYSNGSMAIVGKTNKLLSQLATRRY
jgi:CubicO group peptidase (beta-lactamase class C family)